MSDLRVYIYHMSDGPHRTLNMRKAWKALAERADGAAYTHAEVMGCVGPAVSSDWNNEVAPDYLNEVGQYLGCGPQSHLFEKDPAEIDRLRRKASSPMEAAFAEYARDTSLRGDAALHDVIKKTMAECAVRRTLQAQEHYLRKSSHLRTAHMKGRMQAAVIAASTSIFGAMAQTVVTGARMSIRPPAKRGGLDDGPALP